MHPRSPRLSVILCLALILLGVVFRFCNLGKKIWGLDETFTSLRISGYTEEDAVRILRATKVITPAALMTFQRSHADMPLAGTVRGLLSEEPQHPPLYYVLAKFWARVVGDSSAATRALPALFGV